MIQTHAISKQYGIVTVVDRVDFDVQPGEIHGLLGANGAGKSTLCRMIAGLVPVTSGTISIDGKPYRPTSKQHAERAGVDIIQQELNLIPTLSVAENLRLTNLPTLAGIIRQSELHKSARRTLDQFGLSNIDTGAPVSSLGIGQQQMVEIASALGRECRLLILDEPTAALSHGESERLFEWLDKLREGGVAVVYVSHRLGEIARLTDRITVLRDGKHVCTRATNSTSVDEMVNLMSDEDRGTEATSEYVTHASAEPLLQVDSLTSGPVQGVSFCVRRGERFGIAGLVGSGRTELLRAIFGADTAEAGTVTLGASTAKRFRSPSEGTRAGLAMITEDRKQNGLLLTQSIRANTTLCSLLRRFSSRGVLLREEEREVAHQQRTSLEIKCESIEQSVSTLSGGNQQKVAVSKWLVRGAEMFLFDEPTRGIDVASRRRIYQLMESLAEKGKGIVIVSSDLEELFETCDRIGVMSAGRLVEIFDRGAWSQEEIMRAAFSQYVDSETK